MNKAALDKLIAGRINLLLDHCFFGHLAMRLHLVERPEVPTLAVDGKSIFYNPDFVLGLSHDLTKSALCHEILHCVQQHFLRRGGRDPKLWNVAGDYVINLILKDAGFRIGDGWLLDDAFRDMSTEHIYDLLKQEGGGGGSGPGRGDAFDQVMDGADSAGEGIEQQIEWEIATVQAAEAARAQGKLPKGLERFLKEIEEPQVPWRQVLQRFISEISKNDYSWSRPNKRFIAHGLVLPSLYSHSMGVLAVGIDTSGSIDTPTLTAFGSEITAAFQASLPEKLINIYCDAQVAHVDEIEQGSELPPFKAYGGGGTDLREIFNWVHEAGHKPAALIMLTDGYTPFPAEPPEYPVLWCMTTDVQPPFGEIVRIRI